MLVRLSTYRQANGADSKYYNYDPFTSHLPPDTFLFPIRSIPHDQLYRHFNSLKYDKHINPNTPFEGFR